MVAGYFLESDAIDEMSVAGDIFAGEGGVAKSIVESSTDAVFVFSENALEYANKMAMWLIGVSDVLDDQHLVAETCVAGQNGNKVAFFEYDWNALLKSTARTVNLFAHDDSVKTLEIRNFFIEEERRILIAADGSEMEQLTKLLKFNRDYDHTTRLLKWHNIAERIDRDDCNATNGAYLFFVDIDNFIHINELLGLSYADNVLFDVARAIESLALDYGMVTRLGGDQFVVVCNVIPSTFSPDAFASSLASAINSITIDAGGIKYSLRASIGISFFIPGESSSNSVLREGEAACFQAKAYGGNQSWFHSENIETWSIEQEIMWFARIQEGLEKERFELFAQPMASASKGMKRRVEVLVRYRRSDNEIISPYFFIPIAEKYGLAVELDCYVISKTIDFIRRYRIWDEICFNVNVSGYSVSTKKNADRILDAIKACEPNTSCLCIEITETASIRNIEVAEYFIDKVHELGHALALDDFGNGFASFEYVQKLDFDLIKVSGDFVKDIADSKINELVVEAAIKLAKLSNARTVAEFVETEQLFDRLVNMGIDYLQGYAIAKPRPIYEALFIQEKEYGTYN